MTNSNPPTCRWPGKSGRDYTYYIYPIGTDFDEKPGNYIFCKEDSHGQWTPQYIGQTGNLKDRMGRHHKLVCAQGKGATHIHARLNAAEASRLAEERDLIRNFNPPCNEQLVA